MKLHKIELKNFKCFEKLELYLPDSPGLFLMTGENHHNLSLGANGIGKSTLFDAICWCLYGQTSRGIKAGKLLRRKSGAEGYSVTLEFDKFTVTRSWHPNTLTIDGIEVTAESVAQAVGLTYEQYLFSTYFQQGGDHFIDLGASDKLAFLSDVFDLNAWTEKHAESCKVKLQQLELERVKIESESSICKANKDQYENSKYDLEIEALKWHSEKLKELEEQKLALEQLKQTQQEWERQDQAREAQFEQELQDLKAQVEDVNLSDVETTMAQLAKGIEQTKQKIELTNATLTDFAGVKASKEESYRISMDSADNLKEMSNCPTCSQPVSPEHRDKVCEIITDKALGIAQELIKVQTTIDEVTKENKDAKTLLETLYEKNQAILTHYGNLQAKQEAQQTLKQEISKREGWKQSPQEDNPYNHLIEQLETKIKQAPESVINPYQTQIAQINQNIATLEQDLTNYQQKQLEIAKEFGIYEFWKANFPLVRLAILDEIVEDIEIHFNQALASVGLFDWSVKVATDKELKSKKNTFRKELNIQLFTNQGVELDIDTLSGGELQRLRIASAIGISEMIKARLGVAWDLQLWDEPSMGLSEEGISNTLEFYKMLSSQYQVFIADHRVQNLGKFDKIFNIVKRPTEVSTLEELEVEVPDLVTA